MTHGVASHHLALLGAGLGLLISACGHATGNVPEGPVPDIVAEATADVQVPPDQAIVRIGVEVRADEAEAAQQQAAARLQDISRDLRALQIPDAAMRTERMQL